MNCFVPFCLQNRKNDTNRLANRGGALLKEEKMRRGINKELPKVKNPIMINELFYRHFSLINC